MIWRIGKLVYLDCAVILCKLYSSGAFTLLSLLLVAARSASPSESIAREMGI